MSGLTNFTGFGEVQRLWPREMVYLYVVNEGDTPQELSIRFAGGVHSYAAGALLAVSLALLHCV